jgi:hypothetical protein
MLLPYHYRLTRIKGVLCAVCAIVSGAWVTALAAEGEITPSPVPVPRRLVAISPVVLIGKVEEIRSRQSMTLVNRPRPVMYQDVLVRVTQVLRKPKGQSLGPMVKVRSFITPYYVSFEGQKVEVERQITFTKGSRVLLFLAEDDFTGNIGGPHWRLTIDEVSIFTFARDNELIQERLGRHPLRVVLSQVHRIPYRPEPRTE